MFETLPNITEPAGTPPAERRVWPPLPRVQFCLCRFRDRGLHNCGASAPAAHELTSRHTDHHQPLVA